MPLSSLLFYKTNIARIVNAVQVTLWLSVNYPNRCLCSHCSHCSHCSQCLLVSSLSQWPLELEHRRILLMCCCFCILQSYLKSFCLATLNTLYRLVYLFLPTDQQCWKGSSCKQPEQLFCEILNLLKLLHGWRIFFGNFKNGRNTIYIWQLK